MQNSHNFFSGARSGGFDRGVGEENTEADLKSLEADLESLDFNASPRLT